MATDPELIAQLAVLSQGREPLFAESIVDASTLPDPPSSATDGVALSGETVALVGVRLRADAASQRATVVVDTVDDTTVYTVTLDGTPYVYAAMGGDLAPEIVAGLRDAINVGVDFVATVDGESLVIQAVDVANFTVALSTVGGSGALSYTQDATTATFEVWALPTGETSWFKLRNLSGIAATENTLERIVCAGLSRLFVRITATDGNVYAMSGPCGLE